MYVVAPLLFAMCNCACWFWLTSISRLSLGSTVESATEKENNCDIASVLWSSNSKHFWLFPEVGIFFLLESYSLVLVLLDIRHHPNGAGSQFHHLLKTVLFRLTRVGSASE